MMRKLRKAIIITAIYMESFRKGLEAMGCVHGYHRDLRHPSRDRNEAPPYQPSKNVPNNGNNKSVD